MLYAASCSRCDAFVHMGRILIPPLTPGFCLLLNLIFLSQAPSREQMALCNLLPTYFRPIPPFYSALLRRLPQGVGALKSGSLAPGCFACSEQNGWTAARACSLSGDMVERLRPAETWPEAAVPPSHVPLASFQSRTRSPWRSLTALRHSLSPVSLCRVFFHLSLGQKPHISPLVWGFFSLFYAHISFVPFERGGLKPFTHTLDKENKHTRPAECV